MSYVVRYKLRERVQRSTISTSWGRIEKWLATAAPDILFSLNHPATEDSLTLLEETVYCPMPEDFINSWKIHDGQQSGGLFPFSGFLGPEPAFGLFPISEIVREWAMMKELFEGGDYRGLSVRASPAIRPNWWNLRWIPFAGNGGGDYFCVDLNPISSGTCGQVILFHHDRKERQLLAPSLNSLLEKLADGFESREIVVSTKYNIVNKR
jgi:cell wall assembly regulator SMI1